MKQCRYCAHVQLARDCHVPPAHEDFLCGRYNSDGPPDPVTGWRAHHKTTVRCSKERSADGECGLDGKFWEPR
jgi:hypothetical protein